VWRVVAQRGALCRVGAAFSAQCARECVCTTHAAALPGRNSVRSARHIVNQRSAKRVGGGRVLRVRAVAARACCKPLDSARSICRCLSSRQGECEAAGGRA